MRRALRRVVFRWLYSRGSAYRCVFCGASYSRFLTYGANRAALREHDVVGAGRRRSSRCPNCLSKDRERLLYLYLKERTRVLEQPTRLLHVAPEPHLGEVLRRAPNVEYVCGALDVGPYRALDPLRLDLRALPFADEGFDVVLCNHVLEYVPEDGRALAEIRRVLRPGGFAILQVPLALADETTYEVPGIRLDRETTLRLYGHTLNVRIYGRDYPQRLRRAGFVVEPSNPFRERWVPDIERHGLDPRVDLWVARKPGGVQERGLRDELVREMRETAKPALRDTVAELRRLRSGDPDEERR